MLPIVPSLMKPSTSSPAWKPLPICTVAEASVVLSRSDKMMPLSTATGVETALSPAANEALPVLPVEMTGVWSASVTVTVRV
ncbi:hypothetical protein, partial [Paraburkholderia caballeronis]|uniref:hypothetical protein n=1 Tax=Paraburkholderia caballeronis TaxID=416943 RepID=UPI001AB02F80